MMKALKNQEKEKQRSKNISMRNWITICGNEYSTHFLSMSSRMIANFGNNHFSLLLMKTAIFSSQLNSIRWSRT